VTAAHLASTHRGDGLEAVFRGHVVVVDHHGQVLAAVGDPAAPTTLRSCVKPLQAQSFIGHAAGAVGATQADVAIACGSHHGEDVHVRAVRALLDRAGVTEAALSCGPQPPSDPEAAAALARSGAEPLPVHNNCSGKHAAMLATCRINSWPLDGYESYDHPLQAEIRDVMSDLAGIDLAGTRRGLDGCGLPTHELPLHALARMFAAACGDPGFVRCQDAMAAHPVLVGGTTSFDTAVLQAAGHALTVKVGGAAVWVACRRPAGPALAMKLEAGEGSAMPAISLAALRALGWIDDAALGLPALRAHVAPSLLNWSGAEVGLTSVEPGWAAALSS
jgi:L-asparaginase II